jgi:hypothetical protein
MASGCNMNGGKRFRRVNKNGKAWGDGLTEKAVWHVVREYARTAGIDVSIQTTERYPGCKQRTRGAVNDRIGIEPKS